MRTYTGICVQNKYEGAFDDPEHPLFVFLHGENTPTMMIGLGIGLCALLGGTHLIIDSDADRAANYNGTLVVLEILILLGAAILFLGLFVLDQLSSLLAGFLVLLATVVLQVLWKCFGFCQKSAEGDEDDDGDLHDDSGSMTYTNYMDFQK